MTTRDPEKLRAKSARYRKRSIERGYGKWVYKKRKLLKEDATEFKRALEKVLSDCASLEAARIVASRALADSRQREKELGSWKEAHVKNTLKEEQKGKQ